jgi:hypothetical protein
MTKKPKPKKVVKKPKRPPGFKPRQYARNSEGKIVYEKMPWEYSP